MMDFIATFILQNYLNVGIDLAITDAKKAARAVYGEEIYKDLYND